MSQFCAAHFSFFLVKTSDGVMTVTARHEDKGDVSHAFGADYSRIRFTVLFSIQDHVAIREFRRMVTVPSGKNGSSKASLFCHH